MKQCYICKEWKELSHFGKLTKSKDGLNYKCKNCAKKYYYAHKKELNDKQKEHYENNKEKIKKYQKNYRQNNKEKISKQRKEYRQNNKEKIKEQKKKHYQLYIKEIKEYYILNKERIKDQRKKWHQDHKEEVSKKMKKYNQFDAKYEIYKDKLTIDESPRLAKDEISIEVKCRYCGRYFIPNNQQIKNRIGALNGIQIGDHGLYCSDGCKQACPIFNQSKFPKGFKKATSREVQPELRQLVLLRDDYICQKCGSEDELHCHHIWPLNESPITSADIDECITLCKSCHKEVHKIPGCGLGELKCNKGEN